MTTVKSPRVQFRAIPGAARTVRTRRDGGKRLVRRGALGGTRTPNLLIRSQMLYPLSYERLCRNSLRHHAPAGTWRALPPFRATPPTGGKLGRDSGEVTPAS